MSFSSLKAKLSKNLQNIMARTNDNNTNNKSSKSRVSDHFTFASIFHFKKYQNDTMNYQYQNPNIFEQGYVTVQPSIVVPSQAETTSSCSSWESSSVSDCSAELAAAAGLRRQAGLEPDGGFVEQMMGWIDSPEAVSVCSCEGSESTISTIISSTNSSKRFKVSSSVVVPSTFTSTMSP